MTLGRDSAAAVLLFSLAALAAAYTAQFVFGLQPCALCLYQRIPYFVAAAVAFALLLWRPDVRTTSWLLAICGLAFAVNGGIALFHVGVEQHWWQGLASCSGGTRGAGSVDDLMAQLSKPVTVASCDQVSWSLFGVSMAGYNFLASIGLTGFAFRVAFRGARPAP